MNIWIWVNRSMKRIWRAFFYSIDGMVAAWRDERAFREEMVLAGVMIPIAFFLTSDRISLILMIGSLFLVLALELLNTAIEAAIDRTGPEIHPLSKKAKDAASAAVLVALINVLCVWGLVIF